MKPFRLGRRAFLRGASAVVGLPTLECMLNGHGTALAAGGELPKRFMLWFFGNGIVPKYWHPTTTGAAWQLSPSLMPLAKVKPYINITSGYDVKTKSGGHHQGKTGATCATDIIDLPCRNCSKPAGPSIDQIAADKIGAATKFASITPGVCGKGLVSGEGPTLQYLSHKGPDAPVPTEWNPQALFDRLFGTFMAPTTPTGPDPSVAVRKRVLDAVRADAQRLNAKLGTADRQRLDAHLTAVGQLQKQIDLLPPAAAACTKPGRPAALTPGSSGAGIIDLNKVMSDLAVYAWACDLTRVVAFHFSGGTGYHYFPLPGADGPHHELTHDASKEDVVQTTVVWQMERLAYLAELLMNTPEGAGNLLDQSVIVVTSELSDGYEHNVTDYPIMIVGGGAGALKRPGIHLRKPKANATDVLLAAMQAAGTGITTLGVGALNSTTPATDILNL